jgi:hypothetical protein
MHTPQEPKKRLNMDYHKLDKILPLSFWSKMGSNKRSMAGTITSEKKKGRPKKGQKKHNVQEPK